MQEVTGFIGVKVQLCHQGSTYYAFTLIAKKAKHMEDSDRYFDCLFIERIDPLWISDLTLKLAFLASGTKVKVTFDDVNGDFPEQTVYSPTLTRRVKLISVDLVQERDELSDE
jgi:hypothetical protein